MRRRASCSLGVTCSERWDYGLVRSSFLRSCWPVDDAYLICSMCNVGRLLITSISP